jgi:isopenicillin-N epimerase
MTNLKQLFLLDPAIHFLNHGSYGACPIPVFESYQEWQRRLERQPVLFLGREYNELLFVSRSALGAYLNAKANDLAYIPNATFAVNIIARSLNLQPGDEVLTSDHEYGACDYTWNFVCGKTGASYVHQPVRLPADSDDEMAEQFLQGLTPRTKLIFLSHISSPTALRLPVELICQRARELGILTLVDGAHAMGQIPLDLEAIGADFYTSNCHKWALAPKGVAFLYARSEVQALVEPLVVSWGYGNDPQLGTGSRFIDILQWTGTHDPSAALAVPSALQFMADFRWDEVRIECHTLLRQALERIGELTGLPPAYPLESNLYIQMGVAPLPADTDLAALKSCLYDEYQIEVPMTLWNGHKFMRISMQGYNTKEDVEALLTALGHLLPHR